MKKAAIAAFSIIMAGMMFGCSGKSSKSRRADAKERPTSWSVEQRSLEDITPRDGETQVFIKRDEEDEDIIYLIQGTLSPDPVNNEEDALDVIASYSEVMGFDDVYSELRLRDTLTYDREIDYIFDQYCDNMRAGKVELTVNILNGNKAEVLKNDYMDLWGFSTKPKVSEAEAIKCAEAKYTVKKGTKAELKIFEGPKLVWEVPVAHTYVTDVYVDANNGDIVHECEIVY
ncbi:PepSY domain-containing protein [Ruminococcus flavefaciens]|uniref:Peptidase propeptide and YPEB domain-containing protein n=1 Tax=Ruminococcus flavefaciens TaxID=1265 RepID=A0A1M7JH77_RUMFL|nr:PepSY domain-containing protein [Ruminococcus flavefaciens]SHM52430.1 Peptidase propeptide and YPEB domain-containing protein [Ruminococcus flavefaciens]